MSAERCRTGIAGGFQRALHWVVIAVTPNPRNPLGTGIGLGTCGHQHATDLEAVRCPWTPDPWPVVCDLLVRQVRTPAIGERGPRRRGKDFQLELQLGGAA